MKKLVALAGAGLLLAACSTDPSSAAVVEGDNITIDDLAQVQEDFREQGLNTDAGAVLSLLIQAELASDAIDNIGIVIDEELQDLTVLQLGLDENANYTGRTETLIDYFALTLMVDGGMLSDDEVMLFMGELSASATEADIEVNPRFGEWDGDQIGLVQPSRDYLIEVTEASPLG
ncbi:MAG: hypothetical protein QMB98_08890 [Flaviflexus sp.]|uniref:hypothetical protein n=1 Tax=Flaviflexus sp. TaxID=1969482 RepID=UPI00352DAD90